MSVEIKVPVFPESVTDGVIVSWHKKPGDSVTRDEILLDIETDKVMFEVPAPVSGVLQEVSSGEGDTVLSGQVIGTMVETDVIAANDLPEANAESPRGDEDAAGVEVAIAPAARRIIQEKSLDSSAITGSGKGGRILKEDVLKYIGAGQGENKKAATSADAGDQTASGGQVKKSSGPPAGEVGNVHSLADSRYYMPQEEREKRVPMTRLRARIAERLVEAQQTAAILTTFNEVNMKPVMDVRQRYRDVFEKKYGVKLGFMSFFVKAAVEALKRFPVINASIDGDDVVYHGFFDIGIAVSSERGLVVPILREADQLGMAEIEQAIMNFAARAREGSLAIEDITGGTFTITNGGIFGSLVSTPILNPPQSAILGMHKIQDRPVVEDGEIVIRPMMYLALSYDHRLVDGKDAVQFLVAIKELLEDPARMLLEI